MKIIPAGLAAHLLQTVTTLTTCVRITRLDGTVQGFTEHDVNLEIGGTTYLAASGYSGTQLASKADLSVDNSEFLAIIDSETLRREDLMWGVYDGAAVLIFLVDWQAPEDGSIILSSGYLGEVSAGDTQFRAEMRSESQRLQAIIGRIIQPECDVPVFAAGRCGLDPGTVTDANTVQTVSDPYRVFTVLTGAAPGRYTYGVAHFQTGDLAGQKFPIANHSGTGVVTLFGRTADPILPGNDLNLIAGCDRRWATCKGFGNHLNFQGFPFVPGRDATLEYPSAK